MILPRFSLRWMLLATAVCGVVFTIAGFGVQGMIRDYSNKDKQSRPNINMNVSDEELRVVDPSFGAAAFTFAVGSLMIVASSFGGTFFLAWVAAQIVNALWPERTPRSPFAQHTPAPQLLSPEEPVE